MASILTRAKNWGHQLHVSVNPLIGLAHGSAGEIWRCPRTHHRKLTTGHQNLHLLTCIDRREGVLRVSHEPMDQFVHARFSVSYGSCQTTIGELVVFDGNGMRLG